MPSKSIDKNVNNIKIEKKIYEMWQANEAFISDPLSKKPKFHKQIGMLLRLWS